MFTSQGIGVDAWVTLDGTCSFSCDVVGEQAQFEFGSSAGSLNLLASECALEQLARVATEALQRLRAIPEGQEVCFSVTG
jgi:hypothetical protein